MTTVPRSAFLALAASVLLLAAVSLCGCHNAGSASGGKLDVVNWDPNHVPTIADAPRAYEAAGCGKCHGSMTAGGGSAPDLSHEGSKHDLIWLSDQIANPAKYNPKTTMPAYNDKRMLYIYKQAIATALSNQK